jgi:hypothetical protein
MKRIILIGLALLSLTIGVSGLVAGSTGTASAATPKDAVCEGVTSVSGTSCGSASGSLTTLIKTIINILSFVVATVSIIMIIFGGFRYITSGGDAGKITTAKNTILYAIVGLVVVAFAQFIVQFVLGKVTGTQ